MTPLLHIPGGRWTSLLVAVLVVAGGVLLRLPFVGVLGLAAPYLTFYPAVMAAAALCGVRAGLAATGLSIAVVVVWLLLPHGPLGPPQIASLVMFAALGVFVSLLAGRLQESRRGLRRQARDVARTEERFRQLADSMPQLVWTARPDGTVDYYNEQHRRYSGFTRHADGSWTWEMVLHPEDQEHTVAAWQNALATGTMYEAEHRVMGIDGTFRWHLSRGVPARDENGRISRWYGTATDIDAQKRAEEGLREADRQKTEFLGMLSHELRNPLAPIGNSVAVLARAAPGSAQARRATEIIERQTRHLSRMVDDLLDVTRISRGKITLRPQPVDLGAVVRDTVHDHERLFESRGVKLEATLPEGSLHVEGDPTRLAQVLGNLLANAAKFTPRGGRAHVHLEADRAQARLHVRDDGLGIPPETLQRLFEPFVQADSSLDRSRGGLGIGLSLVKGLTELHGGTVEASSPGLGEGAVFTVTLPLSEARTEPAARPASPAAGSRRVLVIEDNVDAAESLRDALELFQHTVAVAHSGPEGLDLVRAFEPEVVLCDIGLPGLDGYGVARALRADPDLPPIHLVALSGYARPEDVERARASGFDRHLAKPPRLDELEQLLAAAPSPGD